VIHPNELPQFDANISRMLTYSQDFITLEFKFMVKRSDSGHEDFVKA
jgi:hypothetical protein